MTRCVLLRLKALSSAKCKNRRKNPVRLSATANDWKPAVHAGPPAALGHPDTLSAPVPGPAEKSPSLVLVP
jgi:hypothetical protein